MANNILNGADSIKASVYLCGLIALVPLPSFAQTGICNSPATIALAGSTVARTSCDACCDANPATAVVDSAAVLSVSFTPGSLGITGYIDGGASATWRHDSTACLTAGVAGYGTRNYRDLAASATGSFTVAPGIALGARLWMRSVAVAAYGSEATPGLDIGVFVRMTDRIAAGGSLSNLARSGLGGAPLPQRLSMGVAIGLDTTTLLSVDVVQESQRTPDAAVGISFAPFDSMELRAGAAASPARLSLGIRYAVGTLRCSYGGLFIGALGIRHAIGVEMPW